MNIKTERDDEILLDYANGHSYIDIAKKYNLSRKRVRDIISDKIKNKRLSDFIVNEHVSNFFVNVEQVCKELNLNKKVYTNIYNGLSKSGILIAMAHGVGLDKWTDEQLLKIKGFGDTSLYIVRTAYKRSKG